MTGKTKDRQIALRVTAETIKRAKRLVPLMQQRPGWAPFRMTASTVIRVALLKGLDVLEAEVNDERRAQAALSEARGSGARPQNSAAVWDT